jgi:hypothetical protein
MENALIMNKQRPKIDFSVLTEKEAPTPSWRRQVRARAGTIVSQRAIVEMML